MKSNPLVSVCMITYGHEAFIEKAIEGVLMQQTNFDFELIIADDCSPDQTQTIVNTLIKNHPKGHLITYIRHEKNKGMYANFLFALEACKQTYIALCEGDDYWIDSAKLQNQVDFLEAHPDYEVCFTNIKIVDTNDNLVKSQLIPSHRKTTFEHKHLPTWAPTLTRVFRNRDFSKVIPNVPGLDTIMLLYQSKLGKLKLIHEITGAYRLHEGGIYSAQTTAKQKQDIITTLIESLNMIDKALLPKYFGLLFKKLFEIETIDYEVFKYNRNLILDAINTQKVHINSATTTKLKMIRPLLFKPLKHKSKSLQNIQLRLVDKFFIY